MALAALSGAETEVILCRADEAEVDEMWSFVGRQGEQRWLWQALDHRTGTVLAYVFGKRQDQAFLDLKHCCNPLASGATTQTAGVLISGI